MQFTLASGLTNATISGGSVGSGLQAQAAGKLVFTNNNVAHFAPAVTIGGADPPTLTLNVNNASVAGALTTTAR